MQGRIEEAEQLLAGYEELPEAAHALASLYLTRDETSVAAAVIHRRLNRSGATPCSPHRSSRSWSTSSSRRATSTAPRPRPSGSRRWRAIGASSHPGRGAFAAGKAAVRSRRRGPSDPLAAAVRVQRAGHDADAARPGSARPVVEAQPEVAVGDARTALAEFERLGAPRAGGRGGRVPARPGLAGRTGPKGLDLLTRREHGGARALGQGLTNAQIAARLFISTKTAGHHVSNVLSKLHLQNRTEAAGYAVRAGARSRPGNRECSRSFAPASRPRSHLTDEGGRCMAQQKSRSGKNALKWEISISVEAPHDGEPEAVYDVLSDLRTHVVWGGVPPTKKSGLLSIEAPTGEATVGTELYSTAATDGRGSPIARS